MNYLVSQYSSMEHRLNLQTLSHFIYSGAHARCLDTNSFVVREQLAYNQLERAVNKICGEEFSEQVENLIGHYISNKDQIYFEIGMKAGATLLVNLTKNFDND